MSGTGPSEKQPNSPVKSGQNQEQLDPDLIGLQEFLLSEAPVRPDAHPQELSEAELEALLAAKRPSKRPVRKMTRPAAPPAEPLEARFAPARLVARKPRRARPVRLDRRHLFDYAGYTLEALVIIAALWIGGTWALQQFGLSLNLFGPAPLADFSVSPSRPEGILLSASAPVALPEAVPPAVETTRPPEAETNPALDAEPPSFMAVAPTPTPAIVRPVQQSAAEGAYVPPAPPRRLLIPKLGVDTPVKEVTVDLGNWQVADFAAGHHLGTAMPGRPGNMVLAGHRDIRGSIFLRLNELKPGDEFKVVTDSAIYRYIVTTTYEVAPGDISVMMPTTDPTATLITCTPVGLATRRLIVKARLEK